MDAAESVGGPAVVIGKCMNVLVKDATSVSDLEPSGIVEPEDLKILEIITRYDLVTFDHAVLNREVRVYSLSESHGKDYSLLRGGISPGGPCREQLQRCPVPWGGRFDERGRALVIIPVPDGGSSLQGRGLLSCNKKVYGAFGSSRAMTADFIYSNDPEPHRVPRAVPVCVRGSPIPG